jgi:hypothetical protein
LDVLGNLKLSRTSLYSADWEAFITHTSPSDYGSLYLRPSLATAQLVVVDTSSVEIACVDASTGNVGIGTNTPVRRLTVNTTNNDDGLRLYFDGVEAANLATKSTDSAFLDLRDG